MELGRDSYERIIENLHEGLYIVDRNKVVTYWNKAAEQISGYKAEEVVGSSCSDNILTHVDSDGNHLCDKKCPLAESICDKKNRNTEVYMHHKDGHRMPVSVRVSALTDTAGEVIGGVQLFADIGNKAANQGNRKLSFSCNGNT